MVKLFSLLVVVVVLFIVVRERGKDFRTPLSSWQKPEIRHNLGEKLSLADPIKNDYEVDTLRKERAELWQSAHRKSRSKYSNPLFRLGIMPATVI